jgi:hypothetical protein
MVAVIWDRKVVLLVECSMTITAVSYSVTLQLLQRAIQDKRRGMLSSDIVLVHDNGQVHATAVTKTFLQPFRWEVFDHTLYSPDLAPSLSHM